jgi:hypothetical protein
MQPIVLIKQPTDAQMDAGSLWPITNTTTIIFIEVFTIGVWALPSKCEGQS